MQLKEVLDCIEIPFIDTVPDAEAMANVEFKRWTLSDSEIRIVRIQQGPRTGEYLFSPETVRRLPEFYLKVKHLPYKSGASAGLYEFFAYQPACVALTLHRIVPSRWLLDLSPWANVTFLDQPVWRWFGIVAVLSIAFAFVMICFHI